MAKRSQAERDAVTVEIGYAVVTAVVLAGVTGLVLASPLWLLGLEGVAEEIIGRVSIGAAVAVLLWRVVSVLRRHESEGR
ncbi:hypothetical protein ITI46_10205 [Streptomyces oryzae]|uniref:Uncharacterized protein n=1 Tax=Streptomyces oryzae TaxID=1434886 RepID=A0ABS3XAE7_9ACTN|nr:DUF6332 family protein [Streptomyces oryzae]MBO8192037.1 hypothetical protein [Streptomyces oryzae]